MIVCTEFDKSKPLISAIYDGSTVEYFPIYLKGTGISIFQARENLKKVENTVMSGEAQINNYFDHANLFGNFKSYYAIDTDQEVGGLEFHKARLADGLKKIKKAGKHEWQLLRALASSTYYNLSKKDVEIKGECVKPTWRNDTFSGRSKVIGSSVQGASTGELKPIKDGQMLVNFDWISADIRMGGVLSGDKKLLNSYVESDPYTLAASEIGGGSLGRDAVKRFFFKAIYSLDFDNVAIENFPRFKEWAVNNKKSIETVHYSESIMGRKFHIDEEHNILSVFNATIQGSVAHCMHSSINQIEEIYPNNILVDRHDSITMISDKDPKSIKTMIQEVSKIMHKPLLKWGYDFEMPLDVSLGTEFKTWKKLRIIRQSKEIE